MKFKGKTIADVLAMTVDEAFEFFQHHRRIETRLRLLTEVGLGYVHLGQSATTLSGGEAQRIKIAYELAKPPTGKTLYLLDEPTTGLHFADVERLLAVLFRLRSGGNTVVVIEHNVEVLKSADWLIDLGPEGGGAGGHVVVRRNPEDVARTLGLSHRSVPPARSVSRSMPLAHSAPMSDERPGRTPGVRPGEPARSGDRAKGSGTGPDAPGVYLFRSAQGDVVYVGKARSLRRRVLDHLRARIEKDGSILAESASVEFVPTATEREALLLEASLVKQVPAPVQCVVEGRQELPVPRRHRRGRSSLGSFSCVGPAAGSARCCSGPTRARARHGGSSDCSGTCSSCGGAFASRRRRACTTHLKVCSAPCIGAIDRDAYRSRIDRAVAILRGASARSSGRRSRTEMQTAAAGREEFERAALLRDALDGLGALAERQSVLGRGTARADVLALAFPQEASTLRVAVGLLRVEDGEVRQTEPHLVTIPADDLPGARRGPPPVPDPVLRRTARASRPDLHRGPATGRDRCHPRRPVRRPGDRGAVSGRPGDIAALGRLAERLARATVDQVTPRAAPREVLLALQSLLTLPTIPNRIEGVDISIFQGSEAVGSLVVFERGLPKRSETAGFDPHGPRDERLRDGRRGRPTPLPPTASRNPRCSRTCS